MNGNLEITPASVTLTANSDSVTYDGQEHTVTGYTSSVAGLTFTGVSASGSGTDAGNYPVTFTGVTVGTTTDSTGNYIVTEVVNGNLEITPLAVTVSIEGNTLIGLYDGQWHTVEGYILSANSNLFVQEDYEAIVFTGNDTATRRDVGITWMGLDADQFSYTGSNFEVTFVVERDGVVQIKQATLTITAESDEKVYDGTPLTNPNYTNTALAAGDTIESVTVTGSQTEVGSSANTPSGAVIKNGDGENVTANYDIKYVNGTLTVTNSTTQLTIASATDSKEYDGTALTAPTYTITYGDETGTATLNSGTGKYEYTLSTGDKIVITPAATATVTHVAEGTVTNAFTYTLENAGYYDTVTKTEGSLSITPAPLTVTTESDSKVYDGSALTAPGTVTGYKNGETATFTVTGSQTEVGSSENTYTLVFDQTAVATDYTVSEDLGTLTVSANATSITIVSATDSKTYDGTALTAPTYTVTYGETSGTATANGDGTYSYTLSTGDTITITPSATAAVTHVAEGEVANAFSYTLENATNYNSVSKTEGKLSITPATLTVTTESASREYNGQPLTADGTISGFVNGETATFTVTGSQTLVGSSTNSYSITWDGTAVESDYTLSENLGTLEVTASTKELKIISKDGSWTYDGTAHIKHEYTVTYGTETHNVTIADGAPVGVVRLSTGDDVIITPVNTATITHVAETTVDNEFTYGVQHLQQYGTVTKEVGKLSITPATLTITTESGEKEYDGTALTADGTISGFISGETATFTVTGSQTEVGSSTNNYSLVWDGTAVESDYTLSEDLGTLEVTASTKELKVVSADGEWVYDGNAHTKHKYTVTYGEETYNVTIAEGETTGTATLSTGDVVTITPAADATITHAAESDVTNAFTYTVANSNQYANQAKQEGKLTVTPTTLTIFTGTASREYTGYPLTSPGSITGFVTPTGGEQETATFTVTGMITEVGEVVNTYSLVWDGTAVQSDYALSEDLGTLTIIASTEELKVVSKDGSWTYDGNAHTKHEYTVTYGEETYNVTIAEGETTGTATLSTGDVVTITPAASATITHVAESDVTNAFTYTVDHSSQYANQTKTEGKLTVTPAILTIVTESGEKEYDGTPLTADGSISGFANNETATFTVTGSQTEVGTSDNTYTITWDGTAVESDYTLSEDIGELEVTASTKELKVVSADGTWTYDGTAHTKYEYTVTYGTESGTATLNEGTGKYEYKLSTGDVVTITPAAAAKITHVAESDVTNAFTYTVEHSDQYANQAKTEGKLTVTPATLTIFTGTASREYTGYPLTSPGSISGFVNGETATFTVTGTITEVGEVVNTYSLVWDGTAEESDYTLSEDLGTLTIIASTQELKVVSKDGSWTYDGNAHTKYEYTVAYGEETYNVTIAEGETTGTATLLTGDVVTITRAADATITHVAESDVNNAFTYTVTHSDQYANQANTEGKLTVTPATLTIKTNSATKAYDGTALTSGGSISGFVTPTGGEQETATFTVTGTQTDVGSSTNSYSLVWDGTAVESDYTLSEDLGTLEVTADTTVLMITSSTNSWTYDGSAHTDHVYTVTYGNDNGTATLNEATGKYEFTLSTGDMIVITPSEYASITHVAETTVNNAFTCELENAGFYANVSKTEGTLSITPATLTITTGTATREYDGTALTADGSISGFVNNETATFTVTGSQTEVGSSDNTYTITWDGTAVESDYTLSEDLGTLTVTASTKELKVVSADGTWTYDGNAHTKYEYTVTYGDESYTVTIAEGATTGTATLSTGDVVTITPAAAATITHVAESNVTNAFTYTVDHSSQYANQAKTEGKLTVTPATLTIVTESDEKEYDGTPLTADGSISGFANNETATFTVTGSQTEVGTSDNTYTITWDGTAVQSDYTLSEDIGELEVTASTKELKVVSKDGSWTYDGAAHTKHEYTVTYGTETYNVTIAEGETTGTATLSTGDVVTITPAAAAKITHVAETTVDNAFTYTVENSSQYANQAKTEGKLSITPALVTVTTGSASKPYDGNTLLGSTALIEGEDVAAMITGLVEGETATVTATGTITEVGTTPNTYDIVWGTAAESDYDVTDALGTLEITANGSRIVLTAPSDTKVYDSTPLTCDGTGEKKVTATGLPDGFTWTATASGSQTNVGSGSNVVNDGYKFFDQNGEDKTSYFTNVTKVPGLLTVTPKEVTITANDAEKPYDGTPLTEGGFTNTPLEAGDSHTFTVVMTDDSTITDVGTQPNVIATVDGVTVSADAATAVGNYLVTIVAGELEITQDNKAIVITSADHSWTYDSKLHKDETYTVTYGGQTVAAGADGKTFTLPNGDVLTITATAAGVTNVSDNALNNNTYTYTVTRGTVSTVGNYESITANTGTLTINPKTVTITADDADKPYDGTPLTEDGFTATPLEEGDEHVFTVTMTAESTITDVGTQPNVIATVDGVAVTTGQATAVGNYLVTTAEGTLTITQDEAEFVIKSADHTWTYDSRLHKDETYTVTYKGTEVAAGADGKTFTLPNGDVLTITATAAGVTNVSDNAADNNTFTYVVKRGDVVTTGNYKNVVINIGDLVIAPKEVTITADDASKPYDGTPLTENGFTATPLEEGDEHVFTVTMTADSTITDVGTEPNVIATVDGTSVTTGQQVAVGNYLVTTVNGTLKITKDETAIVISSASNEWTYDGETHTDETYTVTYGGVEIEPEEDGVTFILPNGDVITITPTAGGVTDVSDNAEDNNTFTYTVTRGNVDTTGNYGNMSTDPGTLTIDPKPVTVTADPKSKAYGTADPELTATEDGVVEGDILDYELYRDRGENVGSYNISFEFAADEPSTVGFFERIMKVFQPRTQTVVMGNYEVQFIDGEFDITPMPLTITAASDTKVYDGTPLTNSNYTYTALAEGDTLASVTVTGSQTEVGSSPNTPSDAKIVNAQGEDMTGNYDITYVKGSLVVTAPDNPPEPPKPPKTGDANHPWGWAGLAGLAIAGLVALFATRKREEEAK